MSAPRWKRERVLSGPADTLDSRWEIHRDDRRWVIYDRLRRRRVGNSFGYKTMKLARQAAELERGR